MSKMEAPRMSVLTHSRNAQKALGVKNGDEKIIMYVEM
jgi:hypothetical protein